jgi:hypothetical protein
MSYGMLIRKDDSEFEISIRLTEEGEWEGRMIEYNMSRLMPTPHLQHSWVSLEAALAGMTRRWQRLFPDEAPPDFRDAVQSESNQS